MIHTLYRHFILSSGVCIDSRQIRKNQLFFALKTKTSDGHFYIQKALEAGAKYCIIDNPNYTSTKCILVNNVLKTLQKLAQHHRKSYPIPLIALTGTNGKTTTKELLFRVLSLSYNCVATQNNFNNHIGVPLTLLSIKPNTELVIVEMGANHIGEIAELCSIACPNFGLITNINKAHLKGFGSIEGVKKAKTELYDYIEMTGGKVFINTQQKKLVNISKQKKNLKTIYYGNEANYLTSQPFLTYQMKNKTYSCHLVGRYNFENILAALVIANYFKIPLSQANKQIESYKPQNNRSQWVEKNTYTYILDAYNANPASMSEAIKSFKTLEKKKKAIILGDMFELGKYSFEEHQNIVQKLTELKFENCFFCGKYFYEAKSDLKGYHFFKTTKDLVVYLAKYTFEPYTCFLIKGSRAMHLECLIHEKII